MAIPKTISLSIILAVLYSCSSLTPDRNLASVRVDRDQHFEQLQDLIIKKKITDLYDIHLQAYQIMDRFDQYLNTNPGPLNQNPYYQQMLRYRMSIENRILELGSIHERLAKQLLEGQASPASSQKTLALLKAFIPERAQWRGIGKWTLEAIHQKNFALIQEIQTATNPEIVQFRTEITKRYEGYDRFDLNANWKTQWKAELESRMQGPPLQQVEVDYRTTAEEVLPGINGAGNLDGFEYPAHVWSLTFDDGPRTKTTPLILANLKDQKLKATFFQLAYNVKVATTTAHLVRDEGMEIASHSYDHARLLDLTYNQQKYQIQVATDLIAKIQERPIHLFRLPYGAGLMDTQLRTLISEAQLVHVYWNVDTLDWMNQDVATIVERTIKQIKAIRKDAGIILFHDIHERTVEASLQVMKYLKSNRKRVCRVGDVIEEINRGTPCQ